MSRFGDDLIQAMGEALDHAKGTSPVQAADLTEIALFAEALLHDAYLAACDQAGRDWPR